MEGNIEKIKKNDFQALSKFITKAWNETYRGIINDEFLDKMRTMESERCNHFSENFNEKNNMQYIIKKDSEIIAFLKLSKDNDKDYIEVQSLYVLKKYQNIGIGRKLMQKALDEAKKLGNKKLIIGCLEKNKANGFYKKMGGKIINKREFKLYNQTLYENVYEYNL